jgi:hypothetical protein
MISSDPVVVKSMDYEQSTVDKYNSLRSRNPIVPWRSMKYFLLAHL